MLIGVLLALHVCNGIYVIFAAPSPICPSVFPPIVLPNTKKSFLTYPEPPAPGHLVFVVADVMAWPQYHPPPPPPSPSKAELYPAPFLPFPPYPNAFPVVCVAPLAVVAPIPSPPDSPPP